MVGMMRFRYMFRIFVSSLIWAGRPYTDDIDGRRGAMYWNEEQKSDRQVKVVVKERKEERKGMRRAREKSIKDLVKRDGAGEGKGSMPASMADVVITDRFNCRGIDHLKPCHHTRPATCLGTPNDFLIIPTYQQAVTREQGNNSFFRMYRIHWIWLADSIVAWSPNM